MSDSKYLHKYPRPAWKNIKCRVCGLWVAHEFLIEHVKTPVHKTAGERPQVTA